MDWERECQRWINYPNIDKELKSELENAVDKQDRFIKELEFGTGGLRGIIGAGLNRMNIYTVRKATQGLCDYINSTTLPKKIAIAYDSRNKSDIFAKEVASVLAANNITAYIYPRLEPTPALSFAVRKLKCGGGICVTASHNPAKYNGYKVFDNDGCQITLEVAEKILDKIANVDCFDDVKTCDFDKAVKVGKIVFIDDKCINAFVDAVFEQRIGDGKGTEQLKLVYTPLNGSGLECVKKLLRKLNITNLTVVSEQEKPNGDFPTCPYPNPEIKEAMQKGLNLCKTAKPDLLLGTDPDCDRCGTAAPDKNGDYQLISGNEMGAILLDYICKTRLDKNTMPKKPIAVTTIVSTDMVTPIAQKYGVELRRTLTGFKFIGEQIGLLEKSGEENRFIFGFEESYGYLSGSHVRDKDAVNATLLICEATAYYASQKKTLLQVIDELYKEYGYYVNLLLCFTLDGESGMIKMQEIMNGLRKNPPREIGGLKVKSIIDYINDNTGLPRSNVLEFRLERDAKFIVRPSGTEPKIKVYLSAVANKKALADKIIIVLSDACEKMMK